jgi:RND family efflux transporter MFP subunit
MSRLKLRILVGLLAVMMVLPGCVQLAEDQPTPTPIPTPSESNKPTYTVAKGTIVQTVKALGRVAASQEATLFFKQAGRMRRVYVDTNQKVKTGDVLAELETGNLTSQVAQARINLDIAQIKLAQVIDQAGTSTALAQAQASLDRAEADFTKAKNDLDKLKAGATTADIRGAEQAVAAANASVAKAQADYTKTYNDYKAGKGPTASDVNLASLGVTSAKAGLTAAQARLSQVKAPAKASDVAAAQQNVDSAQAALTSAKANYDNVAATQAKGGDYNVQIQQKQVELSRASLQILEDQLDLAQIKAPFDGTVIQVSGREGDDVKPYTATVAIANPTTIQIAVELPATDLIKVQLKQVATIVLTNFPTDKIPGTVVYLPSLAAGADAQLTSTQRTVRIDFTPTPGRALELGSLANVTINTQEKKDVLILPNTAIRTFGGRKYVRIAAAGGRNQEVDIEVGISNETQTEIVSGLKEGQLVIGQ